MTPQDKKHAAVAHDPGGWRGRDGRTPQGAAPRRSVAVAEQRPVQQVEALHRDGQRQEPPRAVQSVAGQELHADHAGRQRLQTARSNRARRRASEVCSTCSSTRSKAPRRRRSTTQDECDPVIEDVEVMLNAMREELHLYAKNRGSMVGPSSWSTAGDEIDCSRMGSGGYSIPSIVEPHRMIVQGA